MTPIAEKLLEELLRVETKIIEAESRSTLDTQEQRHLKALCTRRDQLIGELLNQSDNVIAKELKSCVKTLSTDELGERF